MRHAFGLKAFAIAIAGALTLSGAAPDDAFGQGVSRNSRKAPAKTAKTAKTKLVGPILDRERGGREAPAAVRVAGAACTITEAAYLGSSPFTVNGAQVLRNAYEVACQDAPGYIVFAPQTAGAAPAEAADCLVARAAAETAKAQGLPEALVCRLPGNAQPALGMRTWVSQAGATCAVTNGRFVGDLADKAGARYEVGCSNAPGFFIDRPSGGGKATIVSCLDALDSNAPCRFTTREQTIATLAPAVTQAGRPCVVSNARVAGANPVTMGKVVEIGCQGTPGYFLELNAAGGFARAVDCGSFASTPCQFTDDTAARAAMASRYTERLRTAGYACNISNFVRTGLEKGSGREIVEVACSNRPDGAIALLAMTPGQRTEVLDCLRANRVGSGCTLTQPNVLYPKLTAALNPLLRTTTRCDVANARYMGTTAQGETWLDVTCADGRSFIADYRGDGRVPKGMTCRDGALILGGCRAGERGSVPKD